MAERIDLDEIEKHAEVLSRGVYRFMIGSFRNHEVRALVRAVRAAMALDPDAEVWTKEQLDELRRTLEPFRKETP